MPEVRRSAPGKSMTLHGNTRRKCGYQNEYELNTQVWYVPGPSPRGHLADWCWHSTLYSTTYSSSLCLFRGFPQHGARPPLQYVSAPYIWEALSCTDMRLEHVVQIPCICQGSAAQRRGGHAQPSPRPHPCRGSQSLFPLSYPLCVNIAQPLI